MRLEWTDRSRLAAAGPPIPALVPRDGVGHQFVCYADSCSGVPGEAHEATFGAVNAVVARRNDEHVLDVGPAVLSGIGENNAVIGVLNANIGDDDLSLHLNGRGMRLHPSMFVVHNSDSVERRSCP